MSNMNIKSTLNRQNITPQMAILAENMMLNHGDMGSYGVVPIHQNPTHLYPSLPEFPAACAVWSTTHVPRRAAGVSAAGRCADPRGHQTGPGPGIEIKKRETQD